MLLLGVNYPCIITLINYLLTLLMKAKHYVYSTNYQYYIIISRQNTSIIIMQCSDGKLISQYHLKQMVSYYLNII